jgi:arylsulfatase A-like enzyme
MKAYYALITGVDTVVGRILETLKKHNIDQNTVIIYTSDNGFFCGSKRLRGKDLLYEESLRAPLIVYDPRLKSHMRGRRLSGLVSVVDFAPTILDLAGQTIPRAMQGVSFLPLLKGEKTDVRDSIFAENHFASYHPSVENAETEAERGRIRASGTVRSNCVRTKEYKYIRYHETDPLVEELFDIKTDPLESRNLADHSQHMTVLEKMRDLCDQYLEMCKD